MLTGGEGRLGTELRSLIPGIFAPKEAEMDITHPEQIEKWLDAIRPTVVVHAAAYTNVAGAETDRAKCWAINVRGTANVVRAIAARGIFLVHISTDYVFDGTRGNYKEDDPPGPACNYYSLTKLVAEELARLHRPHLVLRTSFRPREWPYEVAFTDVYTSQDYVDVIAPELALAITRCRDVGHDTLHVATERKSVFELARRRRPDVKAGTKAQANVRLPDDISMDVSRWREVKEKLGKKQG